MVRTPFTSGILGACMAIGSTASIAHTEKPLDLTLKPGAVSISSHTHQQTMKLLDQRYNIIDCEAPGNQAYCGNREYRAMRARWTEELHRWGRGNAELDPYSGIPQYSLERTGLRVPCGLQLRPFTKKQARVICTI